MTKLKKIKLQQNSKSQIVTVVIMTVVTLAVVTVVIVAYFSKNNSTPRQPMSCSPGSFLQFCFCYSSQISSKYRLSLTTNRQSTIIGEYN